MSNRIDLPSRRRVLGLLGAGAALGVATSVLAQIQSQKPIIVAPKTLDLKVVALPPSDALAILPDGSYVDAVDGKHAAVEFRLFSRHSITGKGLGNTVQAWLMGQRTPSVSAGSVLTVLYQTDTELQVQVSGISSGQSVWRPGVNQGVRIILISDGGGRRFEFTLPQGRYVCANGEQNCVA